MFRDSDDGLPRPIRRLALPFDSAQLSQGNFDTASQIAASDSAPDQARQKLEALSRKLWGLRRGSQLFKPEQTIL
jgi:hypothetical protein